MYTDFESICYYISCTLDPELWGVCSHCFDDCFCRVCFWPPISRPTAGPVGTWSDCHRGLVSYPSLLETLICTVTKPWEVTRVTSRPSPKRKTAKCNITKDWTSNKLNASWFIPEDTTRGSTNSGRRPITQPAMRCMMLADSGTNTGILTVL